VTGAPEIVRAYRIRLAAAVFAGEEHDR